MKVTRVRVSCFCIALLCCATLSRAQEIRTHEIPASGDHIDHVAAMCARNGVLHLILREQGRDMPQWNAPGGRHHSFLTYARLDSTGFAASLRLTETLEEWWVDNGVRAVLPAEIVVEKDGSVLLAWSAHRVFTNEYNEQRILNPPELRVARIVNGALEPVISVPDQQLVRMQRDALGRTHLLGIEDDSVVYSVWNSDNSMQQRRALCSIRYGMNEQEAREILALDVRDDGAAVVVRSYVKKSVSRVWTMSISMDSPIDVYKVWDSRVTAVLLDARNRIHFALQSSQAFSVVRITDGQVALDRNGARGISIACFDRNGGEYALLAPPPVRIRGTVATAGDSILRPRCGPIWVRVPFTGSGTCDVRVPSTPRPSEVPRGTPAWYAAPNGSSPLFSSPEKIDAEVRTLWTVRAPDGSAFVLLDTPTPKIFEAIGKGRILAANLSEVAITYENSTACLDEHGTAWISTWGNILYEIPHLRK